MGDDDPIADVVGVRVLCCCVVERSCDDGAVKVLDVECWVRVRRSGRCGGCGVFCAVAVDAASGLVEFPDGAALSPVALCLGASPSAPA